MFCYFDRYTSGKEVFPRRNTSDFADCSFMGPFETDKIGGDTMPTYISLVKYTQKGAENVKESPQRLDAAKKAFKGLGAELKEFYLITGPNSSRSFRTST